MNSKKIAPRKSAARIAVAGALVAIPLAAVAVPASADIPVTSEPTDSSVTSDPADIARPWHHGYNHGYHGWRYYIPIQAFGSL